MQVVNKQYYEIELMANIDSYYPFRPAPNVKNHDHPGFSDPGCDEDIEFTLSIVLDVKGERVVIPLSEMEKVKSLKPLVEDIYQSVLDDVIAVARQQHEEAYHDSMALALEMKS